MAYAENTTVSVERSKAEIEQIIYRFGAQGLISGWQGNKAMIEFVARSRRVRFILELPSDPKLFAKAGNRSRTPAQVRSAMQQEERRLWRSLCLSVKAKLESVESGIATFEDEFMAQVVLPDGRTVAEHVGPVIEQAYVSGRVSGSLLAIEASG